MYVDSIILWLLGDGDLSVKRPSSVEGLFNTIKFHPTFSRVDLENPPPSTKKFYLLPQIGKMDQVINSIGNPTSILIERIFWLCLGGFLLASMITSVLKGLNESKNKAKSFKEKN